jgi:WD40 repeat protein
VYSSDGRFIVSSSGEHKTSPHDTTVRIWDAVSGAEIRNLKGHNKLIAALALSPDGRYIVSGDWGGNVFIWDFKTGAKIQSFLLEHEISLEEIWDELDEEDREYFGDPENDDPPHVNGAAFENNSICWILPSTETPRTLNLKKGLVQKSNLKLDNIDSVKVIAIPPDSRQIIIGLTSGKIKVLDQNTGDLLFSLNGHTKQINSVVVTKDGLTAASASEDSTIRLWDLSKPKELAVFTAEGKMRACGLTPDGRTLIAGGDAGRLYFLRREGGEGRMEINKVKEPDDNKSQ